jgi:hypothetical protein
MGVCFNMTTAMDDSEAHSVSIIRLSPQKKYRYGLSNAIADFRYFTQRWFPSTVFT